MIIGLTGSIGMGKSTVAGMLAASGVAHFDADAAVHRLLGKDHPVAAVVAGHFPQAVADDGSLDRRRLGEIVFADTAKRRLLETVLHPLVRAERDRWISHCRHRGVGIICLDIPLLFETAGDKSCDLVIVTSAPLFIQRRRVLGRATTTRGGMTAAKFHSILKRQLPDREKRRRATLVIETGIARFTTRCRVERLVRQVFASRAVTGRPSSWSDQGMKRRGLRV